MSETILVPFDGSAESRRAVAVAAELARAGRLPVELVTIEPSGARPTADDLAALAGVEHRTTAVTSGRVADALAGVVDERPDAVLVLGSHARGHLGSLLFGGVTEAVLGRLQQPAVVVGPHVVAGPLAPALFVAVDDEEGGRTAAPFAAAWAHRFHVDPWLISVVEPSLTSSSTRRAGETNLVHRLATGLRDAGVPAQWDVLHGRDVVRSVLDFVASMGGGVLAVTSQRWTDPAHGHVASTARRLVQRSPYPVLVVPARAGVLSA